MCRAYHWPPDFWRRMGTREFYLWVDQLHREQQGERADDPDSWRGSEADPWWRGARERQRRRRHGAR